MSNKFRDFRDLVAFAKSHNFVVTSTNGGRHNVGSKHYRGLAIDVRTRDKTNQQISDFIKICRLNGITVRDERIKPINQKIWTGAHLHLEI